MSRLARFESRIARFQIEPHNPRTTPTKAVMNIASAILGWYTFYCSLRLWQFVHHPLWNPFLIRSPFVVAVCGWWSPTKSLANRVVRIETYLKREKIVKPYQQFEQFLALRFEPVAIRTAANREPRFKTSIKSIKVKSGSEKLFPGVSFWKLTDFIIGPVWIWFSSNSWSCSSCRTHCWNQSESN